MGNGQNNRTGSPIEFRNWFGVSYAVEFVFSNVEDHIGEVDHFGEVLEVVHEHGSKPSSDSMRVGGGGLKPVNSCTYIVNYDSTP